MRTVADEARSPKYSHVERERRWLVDPALVPPLPDAFVLIEDRYLRGTRLRLRRMTDEASGEVALKLAKKYACADPAARPMVNAYLDDAEYDVIAVLPAAVVRKRRYELEGFSLDVFEAALEGLLLCERKAQDAAALRSLMPPPWAGREVTHDPKLQGGTLAALTAEEVRDLLTKDGTR